MIAFDELRQVLLTIRLVSKIEFGEMQISLYELKTPVINANYC